MAPIVRRTKTAKLTSKVENYGELDCARIKLNDALDHIWRGENVNEDDFDVDDQMDSSPQKMKRTRGPRKSKKRMREDGFTKTSSFVVKLFDRSIDLAQFSQNSASEDSSLYPVCRAWIRNQSQSSYFDEQRDSVENSYSPEDVESVEKPDGLYTLPAPLPLPKTENGSCRILRVPNVTKELSIERVDEAINGNQIDTYENLLQENVLHWKEVRHRWKQAIQENEERYKHSCSVLKSMYERSISAQSELEQLSKPSIE